MIRERQETEEYQRIDKVYSLFENLHLLHSVTESVEGRQIILNGRRVTNFGSANYLGLEQHPQVIEASIRAIRELGTHAGCSRIFASHYNILALEDELSTVVGAERTLIGHNISQIHAGVLPGCRTQIRSHW